MFDFGNTATTKAPVRARGYLRLVLAIAVTAIVVAAVTLASSGALAGVRTLTTTVTAPVTTTTTSTVASHITMTVVVTHNGTITTTVTSTLSAQTETRLFQVAFKQTGGCTPADYAAPWSVTLANQTEVEPSNATLPLSQASVTASPSFVNSSVIVFSVPDGTYQYTVAPSFPFVNPTGNVTVLNDDVTILVQGPQLACTETMDSM